MYKAKIKRTCPDCKGIGKEKFPSDYLYNLPCSRCKGTGQIEEEITILEIEPADEE